MPFANWDKLLYGIKKGECILFLGPGLPIISSNGECQVPAQILAARLLQGLEGDDLPEPDVPADDVAWLAQRFVAQEGEVGFEAELEQWHESFEGQQSKLHDDLAALPFRYLVTSGHDPLMESALQRAGKTPAVERYHFRGTNKSLLPEPTTASPVLYHLCGCVAEPASVVLAQTHLLAFLEKLIARDPPLPNDLNAALTNGRQFLFLGFGLQQWYLRILLHVLRVLRRGSFAVEAQDEGAVKGVEDAILFYRENFKMDVFQSNVAEFVQELRSRYTPPASTPGVQADGPAPQVRADGPAPQVMSAPTSAPVRTGRTVFICHASEDADKAREIHDALKRAGLDPWLDKESLQGGDRWDDDIESVIKGVDFFVVLNSRALDAKSRAASYVNKEINKALEAAELRLMKSFIFPVQVDDQPVLAPLSAYHAIDLGRDGPQGLVRAIKRHVDVV